MSNVGTKRAIDEEEVAEKKRLRTIKNRAAAQESRNRQRAYVQSLEATNAQLLQMNAAMAAQMKSYEAQNELLMQKLESIQSLLLKASNPITPVPAPETAQLFQETFPELYDTPSSLTPSPSLAETAVDHKVEKSPASMTLDEFLEWSKLPSSDSDQVDSLHSIPKISKDLMHPAAVTSQQQMSLQTLAMYQDLIRLAPMMLFAFCSRLNSNFDSEGSNQPKSYQWEKIMAQRYPISYRFLKNACK